MGTQLKMSAIPAILILFVASITGKVDGEEIIRYSIAPETLGVTIGRSFVLTCGTSTNGGLEALQWYLKKNDDEFKRELKRDGSTDLTGIGYHVKKSVGSLHSVLNVTTEGDRTFKTSIHYTFYCSQNFNFTNNDEAKVIVSPVDYSLRDAGIGVGVALLVLTVLLIAVFLWRRRRLRSSLAVVSSENYCCGE